MVGEQLKLLDEICLGMPPLLKDAILSTAACCSQQTGRRLACRPPSAHRRPRLPLCSFSCGEVRTSGMLTLDGTACLEDVVLDEVEVLLREVLGLVVAGARPLGVYQPGRQPVTVEFSCTLNSPAKASAMSAILNCELRCRNRIIR